MIDEDEGDRLNKQWRFQEDVLASCTFAYIFYGKKMEWINMHREYAKLDWLFNNKRNFNQNQLGKGAHTITRRKH
jgi:hypothetical protein